MALTLNPATNLITIPQADLTLISGTLYELDTNQFKRDVMALLASADYIWMEDAFIHNTEITIAGVTFARTIEFINGYQIQFEDTGSQYSVRLSGSNNNIFDVENAILVPTDKVTVISGNSAGLLNGSIQSQIIEGTVTQQQAMRILLSAMAGRLTEDKNVVRIRDTNNTKDRIIASVDKDGNRLSVTLDFD